MYIIFWSWKNLPLKLFSPNLISIAWQKQGFHICAELGEMRPFYGAGVLKEAESFDLHSLMTLTLHHVLNCGFLAKKPYPLRSKRDSNFIFSPSGTGVLGTSPPWSNFDLAERESNLSPKGQNFKSVSNQFPPLKFSGPGLFRGVRDQYFPHGYPFPLRCGPFCSFFSCQNFKFVRIFLFRLGTAVHLSLNLCLPSQTF